jgi:hypothetical protein
MSATAKEILFLEWLKHHGAVLDKLDWPAVDPATGSRGAIALETIEVRFDSSGPDDVMWK